MVKKEKNPYIYKDKFIKYIVIVKFKVQFFLNRKTTLGFQIVTTLN